MWSQKKSKKSHLYIATQNFSKNRLKYPWLREIYKKIALKPTFVWVYIAKGILQNSPWKIPHKSLCLGWGI